MADEAFDPYQQWLGIDPSERPIDYYRLLGLERFESDAARIADAAEERMRYIRTFQTGPRGLHTQQLLNEMAAAKLRLLNPQSKSEYDDRLRRTAAAAAEFAQPDDIALPEPVHTSDAPEASGNGAAAQPVPTAQAAPLPPAPRAAVVPAPAIGTTAPQIRVGGRAHRPRGRKKSAAPVLQLSLLLIAVVLVAAAVWYFGNRMQDEEPEAKDPQQPAAPAAGTSPATEEGIVQQLASGEIHLTADMVTIHGSTPAVVAEGDAKVISDWDSAGDWLQWMFRLRKPGVYRVRVTYAVSAEAPEGRLQIRSGDDQRAWDLRASGGLSTFVSDEQAVFSLTPAGLHTLTLHMSDTPRGQVLAIRDVVLVPQRRPGDSAAE